MLHVLVEIRGSCGTSGCDYGSQDLGGNMQWLGRYGGYTSYGDACGGYAYNGYNYADYN